MTNFTETYKSMPIAEQGSIEKAVVIGAIAMIVVAGAVTLVNVAKNSVVESMNEEIGASTYTSVTGSAKSAATYKDLQNGFINLDIAPFDLSYRTK